MQNLIKKQRKHLTPNWMYSLACFLKVKYGSIITDARGSIAGNTFSRNHYGPYVRARVTPTNPQTAKQTAVRSTVAMLSAEWASTLSQANRDAWSLYGSNVAMTDKLGATMFLTGYNHFIRSNLLQILAGGAVIAAGPVVFEIPAKDPTFSIIFDEAGQKMNCTFDNGLAWATESGAYMTFFQGMPQNPQRTYFSGPWRRTGLIWGVDPGGAVSPKEEAVQFAVAEGQHIWAYARITRADGRMSEPMRADHFCVA